MKHSDHEKARVQDMTTGNPIKLILAFSLPLLIGNIFQQVYSMVDTMVVGHTLGDQAIAAIGATTTLYQLIINFAWGLNNGYAIVVTHRFGAHDLRSMRQAIAGMMMLDAGMTAILSVLSLVFLQPLLTFMNTPAAIFQDAYQYIAIIYAGMAATIGYNMLAGILRAMGNSRSPLYFLIISSVLNIVLDILLVAVADMGVAGAAIATVFSQGFSFVCCVVFLWRSRHEMDFEVSLSDFLHPKMEYLSPLTKLGIPMAIKSASIHFSKLFVNSWINSYGVAVSAFAGVANKLASVSNLISNAMNTAGSTMVGQNIAAGEFDRVRSILFHLAKITLSVSTFISLVLVIFPEPVFRLFNDDAEGLAIAMKFVPIGVLLFYGSALRAIMNALINGSGNHRINFVTAILDGIVMRIGLSILFGLTLDIGHSHGVEDTDEPFFSRHDDRLIHMHGHDGAGKKNHLALGDGEIDLRERLAWAKRREARVVLETKTIAALRTSVARLPEFLP